MPRIAIAITLGVAAVLLGEISVLLSIPPDHFVPVWIVAALSVTAPWIWGRIMMLPLALATGIVALDIALRLFFMDLPSALTLAVAMALSSLVQSEIGIRLMSGLDRVRLARQEQMRDIVHMVGVVAPVGALPMALLFPAAIALSSITPDAGYLGIAWRSWLSSLVGIVAFAPLCLVIFGPSRIPVRRKIAVSLPMGILMLVLAIVFAFSRMDGIRDREEAFRALTAEDRQSLNEVLTGVERRLFELGGLFEASETVTRDEFETFVGIAFAGLPPERVVRWAPRVERAADPQHDYAVPDQPGDGIIERDIPLTPAHNYPALRSGLVEAEREALATSVIAMQAPQGRALPATDNSPARIIMAVPTFRTGADGESMLTGLASAELLWPDLFLLSRPRSSYAYHLSLYETGIDPPRLLFGQPSSLPGLSVSYDVNLSGHDLQLTYEASYAFLSDNQSMTAWYVLVLGMLFATLLNALTLISTGRTEFVQRLVEQKTREAEGLARDLATIVESAADGILALDRDGLVRTANSAAARLLGLRLEDLSGRKARAVLGADLPPEIGAPTMRTDDSVALFSHADGEDFPAEFSCAPITGEGGVSLGQVIVFRDISARTARQQERDQFINELSRANEELERFAFAASHDLQEPLRLIANFNALLDRRYGDELDEDGRTFIRHSIDAATRMQTLIADLLTYGKVEHEAQSPHSNVALGSIINDVLKNLENTLATAKGRVTVGDMPDVSGIPSQLSQVFQNLIGNALKYRETGTQPLIDVSCEDAGDHWRLSVCDNGIGIAPQYDKTIFEPFKRLHGKTEYSGTGMGLAICRKIVESHDGMIWVEANPGGGSCFRFTLPKTDTDRNEHQHSETRAPHSPG